MNNLKHILNISEEDKRIFNSKCNIKDRINFLQQFDIRLIEDNDECIWVYKDDWLGSSISPIEDIQEEAKWIIEANY